MGEKTPPLKMERLNGDTFNLRGPRIRDWTPLILKLNSSPFRDYPRYPAALLLSVASVNSVANPPSVRHASGGETAVPIDYTVK